MRIDEMIAAAREEIKASEGEEKVKAQAKAEALLEMKSEGFTKTDTEVGGIVKRKEEEATADAKKWADLMGMTYDEAAKVFEEFDDDDFQALISAYDSGDGEDEKPVIERVQAALKERDNKIQTLDTSLADINRRYAKDKVDVAVERAFREAKLDETFLDPAKRLASYDDLIEKVTKGESLTNEDIAEKVNGVKELSGVWFKGGGAEGDTTVADRKIRANGADDAVVRPHIPATPAGGGPPARSATDSYREAKYAAKQTG